MTRSTRIVTAFLAVGLLLFVVPTPLAADGSDKEPEETSADSDAPTELASDALEVDESMRERLRKTLEGSKRFAEACPVAAPEDLDIAAAYRGRFADADHPGLLVAIDGCSGRKAAVLVKRDDGWQLDVLDSIAQWASCLRFRPKVGREDDADRHRDMLVCLRRYADAKRKHAELLRVAVRGGAVKTRALADFTRPSACPTERFRAARPVEWRRFSYEGTDAPPRLGVLTRSTEVEVPDEYDDACAAREAGFDPWQDAEFDVFSADLRTPDGGPPRFERNRLLGGFCEPENIRKTVAAKANAIKYCYERELKDDPQLAGRILTQWRVQLDGSTSSVNVVESTMNNEKVESCITRVIGRMNFAEPDGGVCLINYPFIFKGKDSDQEESK